MLPLENRSVLFELLKLLHKTLRFAEQNKMSAETLGIVFAPIIMGGRTVSPSDFKQQLIPASTVMIEQGEEMFLVRKFTTFTFAIAHIRMQYIVTLL